MHSDYITQACWELGLGNITSMRQGRQEQAKEGAEKETGREAERKEERKCN